MVCEIAHFGKMVPQFAILIHRQLSARKSLPSTPVLMIRIIGALPLRPKYHISIVETQTCCLQTLSVFSAYNTTNTTQCSKCTHFQWLRKNL